MPSEFGGFRKVTPEMIEQRKKWEADIPIKKNKSKKIKIKRGKVGYREYLRSDHWKIRKKRYWKKHKRICFCCGKFAILLHHITYSRLGGELNKDLVPLCKNCHERIHKDILKKNPKLKTAHLTLREELSIFT